LKKNSKNSQANEKIFKTEKTRSRKQKEKPKKQNRKTENQAV
jgi:hypothetical protein